MALLKKEKADLKDDKEDYKRENRKIEEKLGVCKKIENHLKEELKVYNPKIEKHKNEKELMENQLTEWESIIKDKEKDINDLWNKNKHLENFRLVLDNKIKTIQDEKLPMELKIKNLEMHIWQMYEELSTECKEWNEMEKWF